MVVDAYGQLAAEGYLSLRQGARPRVSDAPAAANGHEPPPAPAPPPRFDFRPSVPDVSSFPRAAWLRATREALATMPDADLQYGDWIGLETLRQALADYLGRVRGVVADASRVVITSGYTQALTLLCHALATGGARRIAIEDPANPEQLLIARRAGLEPVPIAVDDDGLRVQELGDEDAVVLTPAHQHPTGAVLSGERRAALLAWLRDRDALAIEDDYDAEYRYDRAAVGALQGLEPDRVAYAGSASKTLAPALRLGWLVVPPPLLEAIRSEKYLADMGTERIGQQAFAHFLERGELDRHLRRMRGRYRARRDALVQALADELPEATVKGIAAGLHVTVEIPGVDERALAEEAARRRIRFNTMLDYRDPAPLGPATADARLRPARRAGDPRGRPRARGRGHQRASFHTSGCGSPSAPTSAKIATAHLSSSIASSCRPASCRRSARLLCSAASRWRSPCAAHSASAARVSSSAGSSSPRARWASARLLSAATRAPGSPVASASSRLRPRCSSASAAAPPLVASAPSRLWAWPSARGSPASSASARARSASSAARAGSPPSCALSERSARIRARRAGSLSAASAASKCAVASAHSPRRWRTCPSRCSIAPTPSGAACAAAVS